MDNIYLTGFMGCGKSTLGKVLAAHLRRHFVDMDAMIVKAIGMSIDQFFQLHGEKAFRQREHELLRRLARHDRLVVATGGGVPCNAANRELMQASGNIIYLDMPLASIRDRLSAAEIATRPKWQTDDGELQKLFARRRRHYRRDSIAIDGELNLADKIAIIQRKLFPPKQCPVNLNGVTHTLTATFTPEIALQQWLAARPEAYSRIVFLCDNNSADLHAERYRQRFPQALFISVRAGETSKSLRRAESIYKQLLEAKIGRDALLVALGGGVVTDLGAFVAATFKRGIDCVLVSTTLLGCVDASVGGKAAVNLGDWKNQVGLFTRPQAVFLDCGSFWTLPGTAIRDGLIEAYKTGIALDRDFMVWIEEQLPILLSGDSVLLAHTAFQSAFLKAAVVKEDFLEHGLRRVLNLGHTYGHAAETWNHCRVSHGRSVAAGLLVAMHISRQRRLISEAWAAPRRALLKQLIGQPFALPNAEQAWPIMANDKKNRDGKVLFVLMTEAAPGYAFVNDLRPAELEQALSQQFFPDKHK
ncbi:MAG: bifunctional shikimate kinase/3-dehydroquinate synthase [Lentisphaeria bacterium]|jgi:shikimate kinase/3-dehydroquinate synthase